MGGVRHESDFRALRHDYREHCGNIYGIENFERFLGMIAPFLPLARKE
jgi:hypothetical protein